MFRNSLGIPEFLHTLRYFSKTVKNSSQKLTKFPFKKRSATVGECTHLNTENDIHLAAQNV